MTCRLYLKIYLSAYILCSDVDDTINLLILHQMAKGDEVADIYLDKLVVWLVFDVLKVQQINSIGEFIEIYDVILGIFVYEKSNYVTSDKASSTGDNYIFY